MCKSLIDYYLKCPQSISDICLVEFVSNYRKDGSKPQAKTKPKVICFINFNKHLDIENHCREQLLLYMPFIVSEETLKQKFLTWQDAYAYNEKNIVINRAKFCYNTSKAWGDINETIDAINNDDHFAENTSTVMKKMNQENEYDIQQDIEAKFNKIINNRPPKPFKSS